jgi:glycosidase
MYKTPDGERFWRPVEDLEPGKEYIFQYLVDGNLRIGDPYADKISDPDDKYISVQTYPGLIPYPSGKTTEVASVLQTDQQPYPWEVTSFTPPKTTDMVIYELLLRDFTAAHDYPSLIDTLNYLKRLGVNTIELMPVMEFEGNISWGYNPDFLFAPDKYYGTKNGLKQFIDAAHKEGIAVIFDIVLNHQFGKSPLVRLYWDGANNRPAEDNPWFNPIPKHPYNVGYDFNHQSQQTVDYCIRVLRYWIAEYHIDGYRFDLSKGFTQKNSYPDNVGLWGQYDADRINTLNAYHAAILSAKADGILILEHFADNSEEKVLSGNGMLLWGNMNYSYNEATMGWNSNSDFSWISYLERGWANPNVVGYMESHDEERLAYRNVTYGNFSNNNHNVKDTTISIERLGMAAAFFFTVPGPKMIWQFGELGYDYSINYPSGTSASRLDPKPIRWDYFSEWRRKYLYNTYSSLIGLKTGNDAFETANFSMEVSGPFKKIHLNSNEMDVAIIGNFDVEPGTIDPSFQKTGTWYDYFSGDSISVVNTSDAISLLPGEFHIFTTKKLAKPLFTSVEEPGCGEGQFASRVKIFPNPSPGTIHIAVELREPSPVRITILDMTGKVIYTAGSEFNTTGICRFTWNGTSGSGTKTSPGIYFCRIETGRSVEMKKLILN